MLYRYTFCEFLCVTIVSPQCISAGGGRMRHHAGTVTGAVIGNGKGAAGITGTAARSQHPRRYPLTSGSILGIDIPDSLSSSMSCNNSATAISREIPWCSNTISNATRSHQCREHLLSRKNKECQKSESPDGRIFVPPTSHQQGGLTAPRPQEPSQVPQGRDGRGEDVRRPSPVDPSQGHPEVQDRRQADQPKRDQHEQQTPKSRERDVKQQDKGDRDDRSNKDDKSEQKRGQAREQQGWERGWERNE